MHVELFSDAREFLDRSRGFRAREPYLTNVIASTATSIAEGHRSYERVAFWTIEEVRGEVRGVMMRTAPHRLVVSPLPANGVAAAAAAVLSHDPAIPGVSGPRSDVRAFVEQFVVQSDGRLDAQLERGTLVYVLGRLRPAPSIAGEARVARPENFELLRRWWIGFGEDTGVEMYGFEESLLVSIGEGRILLWYNDDDAVCAVAHSPVVDMSDGSVARIGPVYTPPDERRRGVAGALTALVSARLMQRGARVMLFTDAANPTSNGVYTRLGYEKIAEVDDYAFARP